MSWLAVIKAALIGLVAFVAWTKRREAINAATADILSKQLQGALDEIETATSIRADVVAHPERVRDRDKFER